MLVYRLSHPNEIAARADRGRTKVEAAVTPPADKPHTTGPQTTGTPQGLASYLASAAARETALGPVVETVAAIAAGAAEVAAQIALGPLSPHAQPAGGSRNSDGDVQQALDLLTNQIFMDALAKAPVAVVVSEELDQPAVLKPDAPLVIAIDPLDGSSNIAVNVSIGTIFSILPALKEAATPDAHFFQPGRNQLAAGFVVYGPQTLLVLSLGGPAAAFLLDPRSQSFVMINGALAIPPDSNEYAINTSNYRHWEPGVRSFVDDCVAGQLGRIGRNHNMRWVGSMVADAYRIFTRGGVFLYPGDQRKGYASGRLRLLYEVSPLAFLVEHAGGLATDGRRPILDIVATGVHERSPLVFGSAQVVETITKYHTDPKLAGHASPLFKSRGLMI